MSGHLITNVRILDGTGRAPFVGAVSVDGNRIAEVTAGPATARPGEHTIDGRGGTLMPGLIEPHAHLSFADIT
ncbi:MAG TPA: amidohydrolase, partial [Methylomirabilota bacterium]|nr:amidohydrolase [Methylomirabilota bacterium]